MKHTIALTLTALLALLVAPTVSELTPEQAAAETALVEQMTRHAQTLVASRQLMETFPDGAGTPTLCASVSRSRTAADAMMQSQVALFELVVENSIVLSADTYRSNIVALHEVIRLEREYGRVC